MRILVAPDGFGGTLSPTQAAEAIAAGWREGAPYDQLDVAPLSDGGPGFVEVLAAALPSSRLLPATVRDPLGRPVLAEVLLAGSTAYVESAQACGLHLLAPEERDPTVTSTHGVGELVLAALDAGAHRVVVGLGGSATNDAGAGLLAALGLAGLGRDGRPVPAGGLALSGVVRLEGRLDPRLGEVELVAAADVTAPLLGLLGASAVYGPQKGASADAVQRLDVALTHWADLIEETVGVAVRAVPGAGAGGGLGAGLLVAGALVQSGAELVAQLVRLPPRVAGAQLVVTGEGRLDGTSLGGKLVSRVAAVAREEAVPCVALAGEVLLGRREAAAAGLDATYAVADAVGLEAAVAAPAAELASLAARVAREWSR